MTGIIRKIHVVGINSFEFKELPLRLQKLFMETENIGIPQSYFAKIKSWTDANVKKKKNFFASSSDNKLINWLKSLKSDVVLISRGDPLWFGIGRVLLENFPKNELCFYPSNTCVQLAFSKLKIPWQDVSTVSIHGRDSTKLVEGLKAKSSPMVIITDSKNNSLEVLQKNLLDLNLQNLYDFWLCEEIGFKNEKITKINIKEKLPKYINEINIIVLVKKEIDHEEKALPLFGLQDETFKTFEDRPNLLTKRDVRIQILADLELPETGIIWDIGSGCGSIGLEAIRLRPNLSLYCIDRRIGSKSLILQNSKRLGVKPKDILEEDANNIFNTKNNSFPAKANRVIVGGCNKKTKLLIINNLSQIMNNGDIIIIPIIEIQSLKELKDELEKNDFKTSLNLIQTYKSLDIAEGIRLEPNNPVFLLKGKK